MYVKNWLFLFLVTSAINSQKRPGSFFMSAILGSRLLILGMEKFNVFYDAVKPGVIDTWCNRCVVAIVNREAKQKLPRVTAPI